MAAWLGVLQKQLGTIATVRAEQDARKVLVHHGWLRKQSIARSCTCQRCSSSSSSSCRSCCCYGGDGGSGVIGLAVRIAYPYDAAQLHAGAARHCGRQRRRELSVRD